MAVIKTDVANRFMMVGEDQDELHVFRVPAGTVIHLSEGGEADLTAAILVDDEVAPALIAALQRMAGVSV